MSARRTQRVLHEPGESADYAFDCLSQLARILVRCGHRPSVLVAQLRKICQTLGEPSGGWDPTHLSFLADVPHILSLWYSDPRYVEARGVPAALKSAGRGPSLKTLIREVLPRDDPERVMRALLYMRAIRRRGARYVPTGRHIAYRDQVGRLHSLNVLLRILRTIERNVSGRKSAAILERNAIHPAFPVQALPAFHQRLKRRAGDFLWDIDGDLRRRERRIKQGRRTRVGVEIFAFEEPLPRSTSHRRQSKGASRPKPPRRPATRRRRP
jgi:Family of unknown function (DUF6502)